MDIKNLFWNKIRLLRKEKGRSQEILAEKTKLHRTYIGIVERWEKNISLENIQKLADSFGIKPKDLFDF